MGLGFTFRANLLGPWNTAQGFLISQFEELYAALTAISPLTDNLKLPYRKSATLLTDSTGIPTLHQQVRAVVNNGGQSLTDSTLTAITGTMEVFDIGDLWNPAFPTRLTVPPIDGEGTYLVAGILGFAANAAGVRQIRIAVNGVDRQPFVTRPASSAVYVETLVVTTLIALRGGDYLELKALQISGGALATDVGQFCAIKLAAA